MTLRLDADRTSLLTRGTVTAQDEPAEIARRYRDDGGGRYSGGGLDGQTVHLGGDVHVPVRAFDVAVLDRLPLRSSAELDPDDPTAGVVTEVGPGATLVLAVPAASNGPVVVRPRLNPDTTPTGIVPVVRPYAGALTGALTEHVDGGAVYEIVFPATPVPAAAVAAVVDVPVRTPDGAVTTTLRAGVVLRP